MVEAVTVEVRRGGDVDRLREVLEGWEVKSVFVVDKRGWCAAESGAWLLWLARWRYRPRLLLRYLACLATNRFSKVLYAYGSEREVYVFVYPPWRIVLAQCDAVVEVGSLEKVWSRLGVEVLGNTIIVRPAGGERRCT